MWVNFDAVGGYNKETTVRFDPQDTLNWYVIADKQAKKPLALAPTPGIHFASQPQMNNTVRALFQLGDYMYAVVGSNVFKYASDLTNDLIGVIGTLTGYVSITSNNANQICFIDGNAGYIYNTSTDTFSQITATYFPTNPLNVVYLDGYFVVPQGGSTQYSISAPNNGLEWDAFDTALIQAYPGNLVGVGVVNRRLFFFKTTSTEVWYNTGAPDFPFRRDNNLIFNYGCIATASIQSEHGFLFWLSRDKDGVGSVMMSDGNQPIVISTQAVENQISNFTVPEEVRSFVYKEDRHIFYVMNWTTDDLTFCYDATTTQELGNDFSWHRRGILPHKAITGQPLSAKTRNLANCHAYFNNKHYIGSYRDSKIYEQSVDFGDNDGDPILRERVTKHIAQDNYAMQQLDGVWFDFQTGIGTTSGSSEFPQAYLSISNDGGVSFGNIRPAPLGRTGKRLTRTLWRLLGTARDFVLKIRVTTTIAPIYVFGAAIDLKVLNL